MKRRLKRLLSKLLQDEVDSSVNYRVDVTITQLNGEIDNEVPEWLMRNMIRTIESCRNNNCEHILITVV